MKKIGYARLAIEEKDLDPQIDALSSFGCEKIFHEINDSTDKNCPALKKAFDALEPGDALVIWKLDRLGKSTRQLTELTKNLKKRKVNFVSLKEKINTELPMGELYFDLMDGLADMETELIRERTLIGLKAARKNGKIGGRPKISPRTIARIRRMYYDEKRTIQYISNKCSVSVGSVYKYINLSEEEVDKLFT